LPLYKDTDGYNSRGSTRGNWANSSLAYPDSPKFTNITQSEADSLDLDVFGKDKLDGVYKGETYEIQSRLVFAQFQLNTPLIHSELSDFFGSRADNQIDFRNQLRENQLAIFEQFKVITNSYLPR
jgi:hypothetical protein